MRRSNPAHMFYRQDAGVSLDEAKKRSRQVWTGVSELLSSPAAWLLYNTEATNTKQLVKKQLSCVSRAGTERLSEFDLTDLYL